MSIELKMGGLSEQVSLPKNLLGYVCCAIAIAVAIRLFMSLLRVVEERNPPRFKANGDPVQARSNLSNRWADYWLDFSGFHPNDSQRDYLLPAILGCIELVAFPVLLVSSHWDVIGAWIGFKALAQWRTWTENRNTYNRFLIGNALVVIASWYLCLRHFN
jgi:hypothetical protein